MSDKDPFKDPFRWFLNASLFVLFGLVALSLAVNVLRQIWPWLFVIGIIVGGVIVALKIWKERREPW
ncbi:hypothetical protein [Nocardia sp. alder85J]|uniref:hypothetical protein n=1 Tax=Nocardia sp. alder85J TaxID=2862949 RepID=UPI001CD51DD3|nr:hypothetical protein [Nocardia sp. alder85J]MCX4098056.1 hypothetical protein [Nocardia sp. alder85J]